MSDGGAFVEVNGARLYVEVAGVVGAPAVVLVHGFSLDTRSWDGQFERLAEQFRVVRYDLRGFGRSSLPEAGIHYRHHEDLGTLLDRLGIEQVAVVGVSLGGAVALDVVLAQPERVNALVLVGSVVPGFDAPDLAGLSRQVWRAGRSEGAEAAKALWIECPFFDGINERPEARSALQTMVAEYSGWGWTEPDPGTWAETNMAARLGEIQVPALVIVGERDIEGMRRAADALAAGIAGARHVLMPELGHLPSVEDALAFNAVVLDFLSQSLTGSHLTAGG